LWVGLLLCASVARAETSLDMQAWLQRPGVRAVAVEFYATWCEPCMKAMPRWQALREKYGDEGLRVIVVNTQDPSNGCQPPKWKHDGFVCDVEGSVAERFGVGDKLPTALLWSWQGDILVRSGHITEVESGVESLFKTSPRVTLEAGSGVDESLTSLVRERLGDSGKVLVVASEAERAAVKAAKLRDAANALVDHERQCELGRELPANALLKVERIGTGPDESLVLSLLDLEKGCQKKSASVAFAGVRPKDAVRDAVESLLAKLRHDNVEYPEGSGTLAASSERSGTLVVTSDVEGADISIDGKPTGEQAGRRAQEFDLPPGPHQVKVSKTGFLEHLERVSLVASKRAEVRARLVAESKTKEAFQGGVSTLLAVKTNPSGAVLYLDGRPLGRSDGTFDVPPGPHTLRASLDLYVDAEQSVTLDAGASRKLTLDLKPTFGSVEVVSATTGAAVYLDGRSVGTASPTLRIASVVEGAHMLRLSAPDTHDETRRFSLQPGQAVKLEFDALKTAIGTLRLETAPAEALAEVDGVEVGRTPVNVPRLANGPHEVRLTLARHEPLVRTVSVREGQTQTERFVLDPTFTVLEVRSRPSRAKVWLDGREVGVTPLSQEVDEGEHELRIAADERSHKPWKGRVTTTRRTPAHVDAELEAILGRLVVSTTPPDAEVRIDGKPEGLSPVVVPELLGGPHRVEVKLQGYRAEERTLEVQGSRENRLDFKLVQMLPREQAEERLRLWETRTAPARVGQVFTVLGTLAAAALTVVSYQGWSSATDNRAALRTEYRNAMANADTKYAALTDAVHRQAGWAAGGLVSALATGALGWWSWHLTQSIPERPTFAVESP
jgi:thiol-disulfide isomerase/thioredoxin